MKTIDRSKLHSPNLKKTVEHEIKILKRLRHPGIVRLYEVIETPRYIHLIMEYAPGGNLQQLVRAQRKIDEPATKHFLWQLLDAVEYCHMQRVCHRDLKLENFVLDADQKTVKLIDFGLSVVWRNDQALFKSYGTPCYTAPEIMGGQPYRGPQVDVWSLGVCLCTMLSGVLPFQAICAGELKRRVLSGRFTLPESLSADARDLARCMLTLDPERRILIPAIRTHRWLSLISSRHSTRMQAKEYSCNMYEQQRSSTVGQGDELHAPTLQKLEANGLDPVAIERAVRSQSYNHEAACYEMLTRAAAREETATKR